jgi:hypothetical protein
MSRLITTALLGLVLGLVMAPAAFAQTASVEGESFTHPRGTAVVHDQMYSGGAALKFKKSKAVATKQVTITEPSNVSVMARADQKKGGSPTLTIRVDGVDGAYAGERRITSNVLSDYLYSGITLQPGTYTIGLKGGDLAKGRNVYVDVVSFPVVDQGDTTTPIVTLTQTPPALINTQTAPWAAFGLTIDDPDIISAECTLTQLDGPYQEGPELCNNPTYRDLPDGRYRFEAVATEDGLSGSASYEFVWDTTQPNPATITSGPSGVTDDASPTFEFTSDETGGSFWCGLMGPAGFEGFFECSSPYTFNNLTDGDYTFRVYYRDANGNNQLSGNPEGSTPTDQTFTVDTTPPGPSVVASSESYGANGGVLIEGAPCCSGAPGEIVQSFTVSEDATLQRI